MTLSPGCPQHPDLESVFPRRRVCFRAGTLGPREDCEKGAAEWDAEAADQRFLGAR